MSKLALTSPDIHGTKLRLKDQLELDVWKERDRETERCSQTDRHEVS